MMILGLPWSFCLPVHSADQDVVINEIFYHPPEDCLLAEFIELYNQGRESVDLSGWSFSRGVTFTFPAGTMMAPDSFLVVVQDIDTFRRTFPLADAPLAGPYEGQLDNGGERITLKNARDVTIDDLRFSDQSPWPVKPDGLGASLELIHPSLNNEIAENWRAAGEFDTNDLHLPPLTSDNIFATPGLPNSHFSPDPPPLIQNVRHSPQTPHSGEAIQVTARIVDPGGIAQATLLYQVVHPGHYLQRNHANYLTQWEAIPLRDDGVDPDAVAGDSLFTARIPAPQHRDLVRYRLRAQNRQGAVTIIPPPSNPTPNYALFVYDGVPPYRATTPREQVHTALEKVPVYHLLADPRDVRNCEQVRITDLGERREFKWYGTFVFNGEVYDHVRFRLRGGVWRYTFNKRMWKFRFNSDKEFQGRFNDGAPYYRTRETLNLNSITQNMQVNNPHRGELGLFESLGFWLFKKAGVGSFDTTWVHFRIIDDESETGRDQFTGDFYGLFLDVEQPDETALRNQGYDPDSSLYKMNRNWTADGKVWEKETNNCPPGDADIQTFYNGYHRQGLNYLEQNLDLERYFSYRSILEAIHHYDIYAEKNYYYLHNAGTDRWEVLPWDLDLTFGSDHGDGAEPFRDLVVGVLSSRLRPREAPYTPAFRNRLREILQLLYNEATLFPLLDRWRDLISEIAAADLDRWDLFQPPDAPASKSRYRPLDDRLQEMKDWIHQRIHTTYTDRNNQNAGEYILNLIELAQDNDIPATPRLLDLPTGAALPPGLVTFRASAYTDPNGDAHTASRWINTASGHLEIEPDLDSGETTEHLEDFTIHLGLLRPGAYRVRVKYLDQTGRWSFWSDPLEFTVTPPVSVEDWQRF